MFSSPRINGGISAGEFVIFHDITERKAEQAQLAEANRLYQTLFMDAPIRIWENDYSDVKLAIDDLRNQGIKNFQAYFNQHPDVVKQLASLVKIRTYNKLARSTYFSDKSTIQPHSLTQIFWEKSYPSFINELLAIANNQTNLNFEMTTMTSQGDIRYNIINWSAIPNPLHDYSRVIISADDITERENARLELQASEEKFRLLAQNAGVGISYFDLFGNILYHNEKVMEQVGKKGKSDIGKNIKNLYEKSVSETVLNRIIQTTNSTTQSLTFTDSFDFPESRKWFSLTFTRITDNLDNCIDVQVISHEITQQRDLEFQMESLARFPRENPQPVMRLSKDGIVTYSNEGGYPILKIWNYEERGQIPDYLKTIIQTCLNQDKSEIVEVKVGQNIISLYLAPITDMGYINIYGRDITDQKNAEEELRKYSRNLEKIVEEKTSELIQAQERLVRQEKLAILGQLASGLGHELRNPLAVINNAIYMLRLGTKNQSEPSAEYLDIIDQEVASANKIITDLLTFARIRPATLNPTDIHSLLKDIFKKFVPPENVHVTLNLPDNLPMVKTDNKQIEQVITNLITNAYQAIPGKGQLIISSHVEENMLRTDFVDTGIGISSENMDRIFEPLFTTKSKGIGLGLTSSKMLTEANGGKIEVHSIVGEGSIFSLYLPIYA